MEKTEVLFVEKQYFRQWWLILLLCLMNGSTAYVLYRQLVQGIPVGNHPMSDSGLLVFSGLLLIFSVWLLVLRLETRITQDGIAVRFCFFHWKYKHYSWSELEQVYLRQYAPLREYGGWGLRYSLSGNGMAYNVSGKQGLQLEFKRGRKLLIGTRRPEEITKVLNKLDPSAFK